MHLLMKLAASAAIAVMALAAPASAQSIKVGIAAEPYPPFASPDADGKWVGWEVEIIGAVCAAASLDCEITPVAWDGIIPALTSKKIDVIMASMSITEDRMKSIDFSNKYYNTPTVIVGAKSVQMDATPESVAGKVLGVQVSTIHQDYANTHFSNAGEIKVYQTQDEANQDLVAGRIDATQADSIALDAFLATEEGKACCEVKGTVADDPSILGAGVGVGLRKGEDDLKAKLNAAIDKIRSDGTYETITKKYFSSDIYGG